MKLLLATFFLVLATTTVVVEALAKNGKNPQPSYQQPPESRSPAVQKSQASSHQEKASVLPASVEKGTSALPASAAAISSELQNFKKAAEQISEKILNEKPADPITIIGGPAKQPSSKDKDAFCNQTCRLFWEFVVVFVIVAKLFADRLRAKLVKEGQGKEFGEEKSRFDKTLSMMCKKTGLASEMTQACQMVEMVEQGSSAANSANAALWGSMGNSKRWALLSGTTQAAQDEHDNLASSKPEPEKPLTTQWKQHDKEASKRELQAYQEEQQSLAKKVEEMKQMLEALHEEAPDDNDAKASSVAQAAPKMEKAAPSVAQAPVVEVVQVEPDPKAAATAVSILRASEMDLVDALCDMTDSEDEDEDDSGL